METATGLSPAHWLYLAGVGIIVLTMIFRANVVVPSMAGTCTGATANARCR